MQMITTIHQFLALIRGDMPDTASNYHVLIQLLDMLAVIRHSIGNEDFETRDSAPPQWSYEARRKCIEKRFPDLGYYHQVLDLDRNLGEPQELGIGDAVDDLADIAGSLYEVAWNWEHSGHGAARWYYAHSFDTHWGMHLRHLQLYLWHLRS